MPEYVLIRAADLLQPYLGSRHPRVLELFSRFAASGLRGQDDSAREGFWLSVGNEAIKFNDVRHFAQKPNDQVAPAG